MARAWLLDRGHGSRTDRGGGVAARARAGRARTRPRRGHALRWQRFPARASAHRAWADGLSSLASLAPTAARCSRTAGAPPPYSGRMAQVRVGSFDYARAFSEWSFVQVQTLNLGGFQSAAVNRGVLQFAARTQTWEALDREGLLPPIAYCLNTNCDHDAQALLDDGALLVRDSAGYIPWVDLETQAGARRTRLHPLYSH